MKIIRSATLFAALVLLLSGMSDYASARQQSDYQIVRNYQNEYSAIIDSLRQVNTVSDAEQLNERINRMHNEFGRHATLINRFIYPDEYEAQVNTLRNLAMATRRHMQVISDRDAEISQLNDRIRNLTNQVSAMTSRADSLQQALQRVTRERNANAAMVRNLRDRISEYDEMILSLVDSLFVAYDSMDLPSLSAAERRDLALGADKDNVVGHIISVIENNIGFLDTHTQLSSLDFLRLKSTQKKFDETWSKLGPKLTQLYSGEANLDQKIEEVDAKLSAWDTRINQVLWRSLAAAFERKGVELPMFNSASGFYQSINNYLDEALARVEDKGGSKDELERYERFSSVWHEDVKPYWQEHLVDGGILSYQNIATIDRKLSEWQVEAQPVSRNWLIILGILGLVILVLVVLLVTRSRSQ